MYKTMKLFYTYATYQLPMVLNCDKHPITLEDMVISVQNDIRNFIEFLLMTLANIRKEYLNTLWSEDYLNATIQDVSYLDIKEDEKEIDHIIKVNNDYINNGTIKFYIINTFNDRYDSIFLDIHKIVEVSLKDGKIDTIFLNDNIRLSDFESIINLD